MKRYRVFGSDFDSRPAMISMVIRDEWEEHVKEMHRRNKEELIQSLLNEYGSYQAQTKLQNYIDLGPLPISVLAFHNRFLRQIRTAFVMGSYYPALTGSCALGERILNHLILKLRNDFSQTPDYKKTHDKKSFSNWTESTRILYEWGVLLPIVVVSFRKLEGIRNRELHFRPETDTSDRAIALEAIGLLNQIVQEQFSGFGPQPWFITDIPGECYIKKQAEELPFIRHIYLPNCLLVGPFHTVGFEELRFTVIDKHEYQIRDITDAEFVELRKNVKTGSIL